MTITDNKLQHTGRLGPDFRRKKLPASLLPQEKAPPQQQLDINNNNNNNQNQLNDRTPPLHSLPSLPLDTSVSIVDSTVAVVPSSSLLITSWHSRRNSHNNNSSLQPHHHHHQQQSSASIPGSYFSSSSLSLSSSYYFQLKNDTGGGTASTTLTDEIVLLSSEQQHRPPLTCSSNKNHLSSSSSSRTTTMSLSSKLSSSSSSSRTTATTTFYRRPIPLLSACILALFLISLGPFDVFTTVSGQVYGEIRRQYWLMCPTAGGNATINVTCMGAPTYGADLGRAGDSDQSARTSRGPIIRIVELRAHLISDQKAWSGFGPRSCLYTRELNKTTGEIAMASLGSLPVPVDPQDNVSDMLMKNCQAQTYCLSTDSKNINARQFSETFKAIPEAGDVFHDSDKQMKVPVVLELGYLCTANPSPDRPPSEMCPSTAKNATKMDVPVKEDGSTVTTWLWSPNYQREDTPSQTSCECILRSSSPSINVTLVAYHVRSWNSKTNGFRNVINQRVLTMYNDQCTDNTFEKSNDPCIPAQCRKVTPVSNNGGGSSLEYGETSLELRLSSECLFSGVPADREFYMRRVWFAIETSYSPSGETFHLRRHRRRRRSSRRRRRVVRKRRETAAAEDEEAGDETGVDENVDEGGDGTDGGGDETAAADDGTASDNNNGGGDAATPTESDTETAADEPVDKGESEGGDEAEETTPAPDQESEATDAPEAEAEAVTEATTTEAAQDYNDQEEEPTEAPAAPSRQGGSGKPTVTVTCYNYARTAPPTGSQRGGASSALIMMRHHRPLATTPSAFLFQTIVLVLQNAPILLFAAFAHFFC